MSGPECMKVLIKEQEKASYIYKDIPVPQPGKGELLVKVLKVSICGSDTILYEWNEGKNFWHVNNILEFSTFSLYDSDCCTV